jgi:hypothetical protein
MELTVTTMMSLDGVTQAPGGRGEDRGGSVELAQQLLAADLVDRHHISLIPVVLREGRGLFEGPVPATKLRLEEATTTPTGAQLLTYVPDGKVVPGSPAGCRSR